MKKCLLFLFIIGMFSCSDSDEKTDNPELLGEWELIEVLVDPGDGSGIFRKVESNKIVKFQSNEKVTSNGSLCGFSIIADNPSEGSYSITDGTIIPALCELSLSVKFEIKNGNLIISYPCIEPCQEKYRKR